MKTSKGSRGDFESKKRVKEDEVYLDSDDDFRSPEGFLKDDLLGKLHIDDLRELLSYLERFQIFCKSIP